ncbi:hypothetical protein P7K49_020829 [Saguinus oedipus]|uniref:Uncharacterized protein n=1 Tax=Saguinus oedipus TaxID=9490 RepID=A0ABQ9UQW5_SAGOE|nr:hypothetical protein P7K49_020829 [Saguinus oedipus]
MFHMLVFSLSSVDPPSHCPNLVTSNTHYHANLPGSVENTNGIFKTASSLLTRSPDTTIGGTLVPGLDQAFLAALRLSPGLGGREPWGASKAGNSGLPITSTSHPSQPQISPDLRRGSCHQRVGRSCFE